MNLPSDKTLEKWLLEYELHKEAHNGLAQYLSYELEGKQKKIDELETRETYCYKAQLAEQEKQILDLEAKLANAVELIDCTSDRWGICNCKSCKFLETLKKGE